MPEFIAEREEDLRPIPIVLLSMFISGYLEVIVYFSFPYNFSL